MQHNTSSLRILANTSEISPGHRLHDSFCTQLLSYLDSPRWQEKIAQLRQAFAIIDWRLLSGIVLILLMGVAWSVGMHVMRARQRHGYEGRCEGRRAQRGCSEVYDMIHP